MAEVTSGFQVLPRARRRQVGDAQQVDARRGRDLAEIHGAELAGADQADAQRIVVGRALEQHAMKIHSFLRYSAAALRRAAWVTQSSAQASSGVKS
jgi:2-hydroxychromene-2-carboxylate isomerase